MLQNSPPIDTRPLGVQYGALPFRPKKSGGVEILLVTSRRTQRWIIPKGWPIKGLKPWKTASREAYEEAGVRGVVGAKAIGQYLYEKRIDFDGRTMTCAVSVFPLLVKRQCKTWPEASQRAMQWLVPRDAADCVGEESLAALILAWAEVAWPETGAPGSPKPNASNKAERAGLILPTFFSTLRKSEVSG